METLKSIIEGVVVTAMLAGAYSIGGVRWARGYTAQSTR